MSELKDTKPVSGTKLASTSKLNNPAGSKANVSGASQSKLNKRTSIGKDEGTKKSKVKAVKSAGKLGTKASVSRLKIRKHSYGFSGIAGIRLMSKSSVGHVEYKRPPLIFFPTYQLDPSTGFDTIRTLKVVKEVIQEMFLNHKYHVQESPSLALIMAHEIMRRVKLLEFNRFRIIALVTIGQKRAQSYYNAVSFFWDPLRDNYVSADEEINTAFLQATVFGVYLD